MWRREIGGKHAAVVNKKQVTLVFQISISLMNPERPMFQVRNHDGGPFARSFMAASTGKLELEWLSQNGSDDQVELRLGGMQGG
mmetsp:Transcript_11597/g.28951  ORF Transcript_11597/g.28951 Transcript_11597/m.28951 type:complete len:84 (+) Transcript_11597:980-1231(+)